MLKELFVFLILLINAATFAQNGTVKTYYPSGKVESRLAFIEDVLEGTSFWYFENGYVKTSKDYSNGKLNGGIKNYYKSGLLKDEYFYSEGILNGVCKSYHENGGLKEVKYYNFGELSNRNSVGYDSLYIAPLSAYDAGKRKRNIENNDFICALEICPEPVGGLIEIESNIVYPKLARQYKLEGTVLLTATITERGIPINIKVNQGLGLGCDEAAIEAVKNTKFIPGRNNGDEVETNVTFKLNFRIREASDKIVSANNNKNVNDETLEFGDVIKSNQPTDFIKCDLDICPKPVGGIVELLDKLRYPPQAKRKNISGEVVVQAKVNELGFVISADIIKGIGYGCDEAAKSVVIKTQFDPGKRDGIDSESVIQIIVPFILEE